MRCFQSYNFHSYLPLFTSKPKKKSKLFFIAVFVHLFSLCVFIYGFFPPPIALNADGNESLVPENNTKSVDRLIFMVLDAFAFEFLDHPDYAKNMPFVSKSISDEDARWFRAHAQAPTVTVPRIKAITAGIIPNYLDMFYNFAQTQFDEGNWVLQARQAGRRILFYGDDTWMQMFTSDTFEKRSATVGSFYIHDFDQIDKKVTERVMEEFREQNWKSWDVLIAHYLGLDHIGHSFGGTSQEIHRKLREMDEVVGEIWQKVISTKQENERIVFCLVGDHGMSLSGSQGGNSDREAYVPAVFWSSDLPTRNATTRPIDIEQVDLAPTFSFLLGVDVPDRNVGVLLDDLLFEDSELVAKNMERNSRQLHKVALANKGIFDRGELESIKQCTNFTGTPDSSKEFTAKCRQTLKTIQQKLLSTNENFNYFFVFVGIFVSFVSMVFLVYNSLAKYRLTPAYVILIQPLLYFSVGYIKSEHWSWYNWFLGCFVLFIIWDLWWTERQQKMMKFCTLLAVLMAHWYMDWLSNKEREQTTTEPNVLQLKLPDFISNNVHIYLQVFHCLNKFKRQSKNFNFHDVFRCYAAFLVLIFAFFPFKLIYAGQSKYKLAFVFLVSCVALLIKTSYLNSTLLVYPLILCVFLFCGCSSGFIVWQLLILPYRYYMVALLTQFIGYQLGRIKSLEGFERSLLLYLAVVSSFFHTGNKNSLETFDLSPAYTGLSDYRPLIVVAQLMLNFYAGPISFLIGWRFEQPTSKIRRFSQDLIALRSTVLFISILNLFVQRNHPFVWTMFSTMLFIESLHFLFAFLWFVVEYFIVVFGRKIEIAK